MEAIIGLSLGVITTWFFSWYYYKRAGDQLLLESERLRHLLKITLNILEDNGLVKLNRDDKGEPIGRVIELSAAIAARTNTSSIALTVSPDDPPLQGSLTSQGSLITKKIPKNSEGKEINKIRK